MVQGTVVDFADFDVQQDCEVLHAAMKGCGTDEAEIIAVVAHRSNAQRQELKKTYAQMWGKDLIDALKSELGGHFEEAILALFKRPAEFDAWSIHDAISGLGTNEGTLIEIMCSRTNDEIKALTEEYKKLYKKNLAEDLQGDTSGYFKRLLYSLAQAVRPEGGEDICNDAAAQDAQDLIDAGEATWGTDESRFNVVLASRSFEQLELVFREYERISEKKIDEVIKSEMSGDIQDGMLAVVKCAYYKPIYFAERLYKSMKGLGTNDKALIRAMVSRSEIDLVEIKAAFENMYEQTMEQFIEDDISGDYKRLMLAVCQGNQ